MRRCSAARHSRCCSFSPSCCSSACACAGARPIAQAPDGERRHVATHLHRASPRPACRRPRRCRRRRRRSRRLRGRGRRRARNGASVAWWSATPISAAWPRAAWCWCSTTCATARKSPCAASAPNWSSAWSARGLAVFPPEAERGHDPAMFRKWSRWGLFDFQRTHQAAPDLLRRRLRSRRLEARRDDMVQEAGIDLRLHSWFSRAASCDDGRAAGVVVRNQGRARRRSWATW